MDKPIELIINKYITECQVNRDKLNNVVAENRKVLVTAPMGTGKTTWLFEDVQACAKKNKFVLVIVNPSVSQLDQLQLAYNVYAVCNGKKYNDEYVVTSTPESLYKVIEGIQSNNNKFMLVVDEAHELYSSLKFRNKFRNIKKYETKAEKVIYMTATPKPLMFDEFDSVADIVKKQMPISTKLMLVDEINSDVITDIAKTSLEKSELVAIHNNDKKVNNQIGGHFSLSLNKVNQVLLENYQENLIDIPPTIEYQDVKGVSVLSVEKKNDSEYVSLVNNSKLLTNTKLFISTSCIKAGLNIDNDKRTSIIIVCDKKDFNYIDQMQTLGRYRNHENIDEMILIIKRTCDNLSGKQYYPFETICEDNISRALGVVKTDNDDIDRVVSPESLAKIHNINFNSEKHVFEVDMQNVVAESLDFWAKSLLNFPLILKKELENETALNLKVMIENYEKKEFDTNMKEELKDIRRAQKERFYEAVEYVLTCDELTQCEIINHTVDQRRAENKENVQVMKTLHETFPSSLKKLFNQIRNELDLNEVQAFNLLTTQKNKVICNMIEEKKLLEYNNQIKLWGLKKSEEKELSYKRYKGTKDFAMHIRIRWELRDIEVKQGSLSKMRIVQLIEILRELKYISDKVGDKKALDETIEYLEMTYNLSKRARSTYITSVKY